MKTMLALSTLAVAAFAGCATSDDHSSDRYGTGYGERQPVRTDEGYVYVRERSDWRERENIMEPRVRGKHAEALGWDAWR